MGEFWELIYVNGVGRNGGSLKNNTQPKSGIFKEVRMSIDARDLVAEWISSISVFRKKLTPINKINQNLTSYFYVSLENLILDLVNVSVIFLFCFVFLQVLSRFKC